MFPKVAWISVCVCLCVCACVCVLKQVDRSEGWHPAQRSVGRTMLSQRKPVRTASSMESAPTYTRYYMHTDKRKRRVWGIQLQILTPLDPDSLVSLDHFLLKIRNFIFISIGFPYLGFKKKISISLSVIQFYEECTASIWERDEDFQIQRSPSRWSSLLWKVRWTVGHISPALIWIALLCVSHWIC